MARGNRAVAATTVAIALFASAACGGDDGEPEGQPDPAVGPESESTPEPTDPAAELAGRGPVLELPDHTVQVVFAEFNPNVPELAHGFGWDEPAPSGATYLRVMVRVEAVEAGRQTEPPSSRMALYYPGCADVDLDFVLMDCGLNAVERTDYLTAEQVLAEEPYGVRDRGVLEADTPYFILLGNPVSEDNLPVDAQVCEPDTNGEEPSDNCIPVGEIA